MRVVALVLSVDEAGWLQRSLPAACAQVEVLVVDNACTDASAEVAASCGAGVLALASRRSYAAAMNAGLRACADADAVLLLNADCVLAPGFAAAASPRLAEPGVGSVAPLVVRDAAPDSVDAAGMTLDRRRKNGLAGHGEPVAAWASRRGEAFGPDGACALVRREVLDALGPEVLDEDLALWATDADLGWRMRALGWRCVFEPAARACHRRFYAPSSRGLVSEDHRRLQFRNRLLMIAKNDRPGALARDLPWVLAYEALALGHALLRERHLLRGYREAWALRGAMRAKRRGDLRGRVPFGLRARG